jgi:hypothetical protein
MKLLKVKVHYHETEVCHMASRFRRLVKLVEHFGNIGWKVCELAWNLHEFEFTLMRSHLTKGVLTY